MLPRSHAQLGRSDNSSPVIVVPALVPPLIIRIVDIVVEALDIADLTSSPVRDLLWCVFDVVARVVEVLVDAVVEAIDLHDCQRVFEMSVGSEL